MRFWRAMVLAIMVAALSVSPAAAGPAEDVARQTAAVEAALSEKAFTTAEELARAALALAEQSLGAETLEAGNLNRLLGDALFSQERYVEAEPHYRTALSLRETLLGLSHLDTAVSANDLGLVLKRQQRYAEAEPYYREVVAIREAAQGKTHPDTAKAAFWVSRLFDAAGQYADAAREMGDAVARAVIAFGPADPTTLEWMGERAAMLHDADDLEAAEPAYLEVIGLGATVFAANDPVLASARQGLANLYAATGREAEAVPLYRAALAAREASFGPDGAATINSADRLARALWATEQIAEAETLFQRVLAAREQSDGTQSRAVADALRWIGRAASAQNRRADAEIALKRALAISEQTDGPEGVLTAFDLIALGQLYSGQQRFTEARPLLQRAVATLEASVENLRSAAAARMALSFLELADGNGDVATVLAERSLADLSATDGAQSRGVADIQFALGSYRHTAGDLAEAERLVSAARAIYETIAPTSRSLLRTSSELGRIRQDQGRFDEALLLHRAVYDELAARFGADSSELQPALSDIGSALFGQGDFAGAADAFERSTAIIEQLAAIDAEVAFSARTGDVEDQAIARAAVFDNLVKADYRLAEARPERAPELAAKAFLTAQRVIESEAASALAQMAARQAAGTGDLAAVVRERQDLVADWQRQDSALTLALAAPAESRDSARIAALRTELAATDGQVGALDARLAGEFPQFAQLQRPALQTVAEVQAGLGENEVLLLFADTNKLGGTDFETYLWAIPKTGEPRWVRLPRTTGELWGAVRELRNGMGVGTATRGPSRVGGSGDSTDRVLAAASQLNAALLGQVGDLIANRDLLIVPSKSLAALPFHALVSALPEATSKDRYREARWLARDHAITILPSVASLAPVPQSDTAEVERVAYLAFANPLLLGGDGSDRRAFERGGCAPATSPATMVAAIEMPALSTLFRGGSADVAAVRALPPLPETTDEVCAIATLLGTGPEALRLGAEATEATLKLLSTTGELLRPRVLHFATHGLVSGELSGLAEPAIVLTPPDAAGPDDDGLLTASEVTTLKLDADWVILSACNTASSDGGGEALSGLARAFFYAGARALMVSHWPVSSDAAVRLASGAVAALAGDPTISRAEALRRAMLAEIDRGGASADPANWAPFILVGAS